MYIYKYVVLNNNNNNNKNINNNINNVQYCSSIIIITFRQRSHAHRTLIREEVLHYAVVSH